MHRFIEPEPNSGCWLWMGCLNSTGYGQHRLIYEQELGPVPHGMDLDHKCRVRCCVNPRHLEPVTRRENLLRGNGNGRKTHCPAGHEYSEANTYFAPRKEGHQQRHCRICKARQFREFKAREARKAIEWR